MYKVYGNILIDLKSEFLEEPLAPREETAGGAGGATAQVTQLTRHPAGRPRQAAQARLEAAGEAAQ